MSRLKSREGGLSAFILMQKILPPAQQSVLVRNGKWEKADTVSELGIYGTFLRRGKTVLLNKEVGCMRRGCASCNSHVQGVIESDCRSGWLIGI